MMQPIGAELLADIHAQGVASFAVGVEHYADQHEQDHQDFVTAIRCGRLEAARGYLTIQSRDSPGEG